MPKKLPVPKKLAIAKPPPTKKQHKREPNKLPYDGWTPMKDGVSQSLLQKFMGDTERFHIRVVRGFKETDRKEAMEYGSIFHKVDEIACGMGKLFSQPKLVKEMSTYLKRTYPSTESAMLGRIAIIQYEHYKNWDISNPQYKHLEQEPVFKENFELPPTTFKVGDVINIRIPPGVIIPLRGRIDGIIEHSGMWIKETKTKSQINISHLQDTIHTNIQVMFYALCSQLKYGRPCKGVVYNVIRKPGLRQKIKESDEAYLQRISDAMKDDPGHYFHRLTVEFAPGQVERWVRQELVPLLYRVYLWWKSIEANPLEPWTDGEGNINPFHGRKSFGIYDSMVLGKGDFYNLLVYGRKQGLIHDPQQFPELEEDDE